MEQTAHIFSISTHSSPLNLLFWLHCEALFLSKSVKQRPKDTSVASEVQWVSSYSGPCMWNAGMIQTFWIWRRWEGEGRDFLAASCRGILGRNFLLPPSASLNDSSGLVLDTWPGLGQDLLGLIMTADYFHSTAIIWWCSGVGFLMTLVKGALISVITVIDAALGFVGKQPSRKEIMMIQLGLQKSLSTLSMVKKLIHF